MFLAVVGNSCTGDGFPVHTAGNGIVEPCHRLVVDVASVTDQFDDQCLLAALFVLAGVVVLHLAADQTLVTLLAVLQGNPFQGKVVLGQAAADDILYLVQLTAGLRPDAVVGFAVLLDEERTVARQLQDGVQNRSVGNVQLDIFRLQVVVRTPLESPASEELLCHWVASDHLFQHIAFWFGFESFPLAGFYLLLDAVGQGGIKNQSGRTVTGTVQHLQFARLLVIFEVGLRQDRPFQRINRQRIACRQLSV